MIDINKRLKDGPPLSFSDLKKIELYDPLVHSTLRYVREGVITEEQALFALVIVLTDQIKYLQDELVKSRQREMPQYMVDQITKKREGEQ